MKKPLSILTMVALVLSALVLVPSLRKSWSEQSGEEAPKRAASAKSERGSHHDGPGARPVAALRKLLEGSARLSDFERLRALVGKLSEAELQELIHETGFEEEKGFPGWMRVALFAEWARRDPAGALGSAESKRPPGIRSWALQQVFYGVYLGWAEIDPAAALASLQGLDGEGVDRYWEGQAYTQVYQELAKEDPEAAWNALPTTGERRKDALRGFFESFGKIADVLPYAERWAEVYRGSVRGILFNVEFSRPSPAPSGDELEGIHLGVAMADLDLAAAKDWILKESPGERSARWSNSYHRWGIAHPDQGLEILSRREGVAEILARGIIHGDPTLASQVIETLPPGAQQRVFQSALMTVAAHDVQDYFPGPERANRLPEFEAYYQHMLSAVEIIRFDGERDGERASSLCHSVHRTFAALVPAAREAMEAARNQ